MKKVGLIVGLSFLFLLIISTYSFAQMELGKKCKYEMEMKGEKLMSSEKCGMHHQMECCKMGMKMCGMMGEEDKMSCCKKEFFLCCKKKLELAKKQVKALKSIKMDFMKKKFKMEAELQIAKLELKELMSEDDASLKEIESKFRTVEKLKTDKKISHLRAFREAKEVLTEEQKEKMMKYHGK